MKIVRFGRGWIEDGYGVLLVDRAGTPGGFF